MKRKQIKKADRILIWNKYGKRCSYCGEPLKYKDMQVDHIQAKRKGGDDDIENYNPACRSCNYYKDTFTIDMFRRQLESLHERLVKSFIVRLAIKYKILSLDKKVNIKFYFEKYNETFQYSKNKVAHEKVKEIAEFYGLSEEAQECILNFGRDNYMNGIKDERNNFKFEE